MIEQTKGDIMILKPANQQFEEMNKEDQAHHWHILSNTWGRFGAQHYVTKRGRSWWAEIPHFVTWPSPFKTKKAAMEMVDTYVCNKSLEVRERGIL